MNLPSTMRSLRFSRHGGPEVLGIETVPVPAPGPGEILVEIHAAAVNPSDARNVAGSMPQTTMPRTPGRDFAGRVVAGTGWPVGAEVFGTSGHLGFTRDGTHAEYVVVLASGAVRKPAALPMTAAACLGVPFVTACEGLRRAGIDAGQRVLVVGGGAVGSAVAQLARWRSARVVVTSTRGGPAPAPGVEVLDLRSSDLAAAAALPGGFDVVFNTVGGPTFAPSVAALARGGRLVVIAAAADPMVSFDLRDFYRRDLRFVGVDSLKLSDEAAAALLSGILPGLEAGALVPAAPTEITLEHAPDAYRSALRGGPKHVLVRG
jgi:NADPH:quinone reductase-like Zn-dependent oxidoreductase